MESRSSAIVPGARLRGFGGVMLFAALAACARTEESSVAVVTSTGAAGVSVTGTVSVVGSSTIAPVLGELGRLFEAGHPGTRINVETGGSTRGIVEARSGRADIGMVSRALTVNEQDLAAYLVARDGVALILHSGLEVQSLEREQVIDIYTGRIDRWVGVGGPDAPISVIHKAEGRSTLEVFLDHFGLKPTDVRPSVVVGDNQQCIKSVASIPGAIGYVSIGAAEFAVADGVGIRLLPLDGICATTANVRAKRYALTRELNLVTDATVSPVTRAFIVLSSDATETIRDLYFVPIGD